MGLLSNKKKLCPICGGPTPRLLADAVEGIPICKECSKKADMPGDIRQWMSLEDFRQYITYYEENQALRNVFQETFHFNCGGWTDALSLDTGHGLFRLKMDKDSLALESSCLKAFCIREDNTILFESSPQGLKWYETDTIEQARAMQPLIDQYETQRQHYEQMQQMNEMIEEMGKRTDTLTSHPSTYVSPPSLDIDPPIERFYVELTLEHPYWSGVRTLDDKAPDWGLLSPSARDFIRSYEKKVEVLHALALHLMHMIDPYASEIQIPLGTPAGGIVEPRSATDPVEEIKKYKTLLDSGVITEEEFAAKKRQLMNI